MLRRLRDWYITRKTLAVIGNRECRHDGSEPMCAYCFNHWTGW